MKSEEGHVIDHVMVHSDVNICPMPLYQFPSTHYVPSFHYYCRHYDLCCCVLLALYPRRNQASRRDVSMTIETHRSVRRRCQMPPSFRRRCRRFHTRRH